MTLTPALRSDVGHEAPSHKAALTGGVHRDGVYDPGSANGRLLLGLKGTISEPELRTIRSRLTAGLRKSSPR